MATAADVYEAIASAISATSVDSKTSTDVFSHYEGDLDAIPARDRVFVLTVVEGPDRVTERMGCQEKSLSLDLGTVYILTPGTTARMLADGEAQITTITGLIGTAGITEVTEEGTSYEHAGQVIVSNRAFRVTYSGV